jgi:surface protein
MMRPAALLCAVSLLEVVAGSALDNDGIRAALTAWGSDSAAAEATYGHISTWETGGVTDMSKLFQNALSFNEDIGAWDTSGVTDMARMFRNALAFNQDIGDWDTSGVTSMESMFNQASAFNQDIGDWDISGVTSMGDMFYYASAFDQDLGWCVADDVNLDLAFSGNPCESTSCGVERVADGCTPAALASDAAASRSAAFGALLGAAALLML